jgi:hypothetical protein
MLHRHSRIASRSPALYRSPSSRNKRHRCADVVRRFNAVRSETLSSGLALRVASMSVVSNGGTGCGVNRANVGAPAANRRMRFAD